MGDENVNVKVVHFKDSVKPQIRGKGIRQVMIDVRLCDLCEKKYAESEIQRILIRHNFGWKFCQNCIDQGWAKEEILMYLDKGSCIPLAFLLNNRYLGKFCFKNDSTREVVLKFWRRSQDAVQTTVMSPYGFDNITDKVADGDNAIMIGFRDYNLTTDPVEAKNMTITQELIDNTIVPGDRSKERQQRGVSLKNLFYYNPDIYDALLDEPSLLGGWCPVKIVYSDLSDKLQQIISDHRNMAISLQSDGRFHR